jgi:hypothetical protein
MKTAVCTKGKAVGYQVVRCRADKAVPVRTKDRRPCICHHCYVVSICKTWSTLHTYRVRDNNVFAATAQFCARSGVSSSRLTTRKILIAFPLRCMKKTDPSSNWQRQQVTRMVVLACRAHAMPWGIRNNSEKHALRKEGMFHARTCTPLPGTTHEA